MTSRRPRFDIDLAPRAKRREWVRNARRAHINNTGEAITVAEAWTTWAVRDCGPQTWARLTERNGIRCAS